MDQTSLHMRPANDDDAPLIVSILHAAFEEYRVVIDPPPGVFKETVDSVWRKRFLTRIRCKRKSHPHPIF